MPERTKISFSSEELALMQETRFLLTKRTITKKLYALMGDIRSELKVLVTEFPELWPGNLKDDVGKISRGENYQGLPYVILDYPRHFQQTDIMSCRTMFWWGQHISFTLHLQGDTLHRYRENLIVNISQLRSTDVYLSIGTEPWEHHFEETNYRLVSELAQAGTDWAKFLSGRPFVRLATKLPIPQYAAAPQVALQQYQLLLSVLR